MSAPDYPLTTEPVVAWRSWRVLAFTRLDGSTTVRLCAVGTSGTPKVWEPCQATTAICSRYTSEHEAPWRSCECGVWALKCPEETRQRMADLMLFQDGEPLGWAMGKVSLWGRVIEHEHGWRGQYAYPYALTIESSDEDAARTVRNEYAVEVEWAGGELLEKVLAKRDEKREERDALVRKTNKTLASLRRLTASHDTERRAEQERREQEHREREQALRAMPPLPTLGDLSIDDVLAAVVARVVGWHQANAWHKSHSPAPWGRETTVEERMDEARLLDAPVWDVTECVLFARGEEPPFSEYPSLERHGLREARGAVIRAMRAARKEGYLAYGRPFDARNNGGRNWFITRRGLARTARSAADGTAPYYTHWRGEWHRHDVGLTRAVRLLRRHPRPLFVEEVEALLPTWMEERRAAQKQGRRAYRAWLRERRENGRPEMLWFEDSEVEAVVCRLCRRQETVTAVQVMNELAPADKPGDRSQSEIGRVRYQLTRLHRQGRLSRSKGKGAAPQWSPANSNPEA